jgi:hypothetical protein
MGKTRSGEHGVVEETIAAAKEAIMYSAGIPE